MSLQVQRHGQDISEHRTIRQMVVEKLRQAITHGCLTFGQKDDQKIQSYTTYHSTDAARKEVVFRETLN
jgi:hypothetical protein